MKASLTTMAKHNKNEIKDNVLRKSLKSQFSYRKHRDFIAMIMLKI